MSFDMIERVESDLESCRTCKVEVHFFTVEHVISDDKYGLVPLCSDDCLEKWLTESGYALGEASL